MPFYLREEVLEGIDKRLELFRTTSAHLTKRLDPGPDHWINPDGLQYHVEEAVELIPHIFEAEFFAQSRAMPQNGVFYILLLEDSAGIVSMALCLATGAPPGLNVADSFSMVAVGLLLGGCPASAEMLL